ncbi:hypothetical protein LAZ67_12003595 [Cordylochernes scorpioides]|uniref:Mariner Mos1 transposase n=1 Tax=Cordylochernes scorpioides TaxID=51811 RepID=A0ABY6L2I7_9ARAC|nr:hypothetical protein LAZ67_12003595 [Cordylochernes scorpioides]
MRLSRALREQRLQYANRHDKVILQHDNARPHVAAPVKTYLETLKWEVLPHPPYSPDIAPSDYYRFRSMQHGLTDQHFSNYDEVKKWIDEWITTKEPAFFRDGIRQLPERWEKVVAKHPAYSPDLAPSDYFLFGLQKKELKGKRFDSDEDVQKVVQDFFHTLPKSAYKEGIYKLPELCRRCIESQGDYFE